MSTDCDADISHATITDLESFDILSHLDDFPDGFVSRNQLFIECEDKICIVKPQIAYRKLGDEFTLMNMAIGAAHT